VADGGVEVRCAMISAKEIAMSSITFDTHEFVKRLRDSGFTETQAEALSIAQKESLSQALDGHLATKTDITDLRRDMAEMKYDLLKWVVGIALAQIGLLVGILIKLLQ